MFGISDFGPNPKLAEIASDARVADFSPDGTRIASGGLDGTIRLWTLDGKPTGEPLKGHVGSVESVAFSPDGKYIASGGEDGTVRLWTLDGKPFS